MNFTLKSKVNTGNDQMVQKYLFRLIFIKTMRQLTHSFHAKDEIIAL